MTKNIISMENIFEKEVTDGLINRIEKLNPESQPQWGKMSVGQMLAHCSVTYEMVYTDIHPKATGVKKFFLKSVIKRFVCSEKPYPKNAKTGSQFIQTSEKEFEKEKKKLIDFLVQAQKDGEPFYEGKASNSFGVLSVREWNNMFYKHLEHHLQQFGV